MNAPEPADATQETVSPIAGRWYALALITLIYGGHFLDRSLMSLVAEPIRREFGLSDSQLGMLTGLGFGLMFALAGIPVGLLVDRVNRRRLLAGAVFLWSGATALCGMAQNYTSLLIARMAVGAAESGGAPTSMSLISDYFPPQQRGTAVGFYYLGNAVGGVLCFAIGSYVIATHGWRAAFFIGGIPGLLLALLALLTLREPKRGGSEVRSTSATYRATPLLQALKQIALDPALLSLFLAVSLAAAAVATMASWLPPFLIRSHGMDIGHASLVVALAAGGFGAFGSACGGALADRVSRGSTKRRAIFAAAAMLIAAPASLLFALVSTGWAVALAFLCFLLIFAVIPIAFGSMLTLAAPGTRGVTTASMQIASNLLGYGFGPFAAGVVSDAVGGPQSLRVALSVVTPVCCLGAVLCFVLVARSTRQRPAT